MRRIITGHRLRSPRCGPSPCAPRSSVFDNPGTRAPRLPAAALAMSAPMSASPRARDLRAQPRPTIATPSSPTSRSPPRNADGKVEAIADVVILRPSDASHGNGTLLLEVPNRGRKLAPQLFDDSAQPGGQQRGQGRGTPALASCIARALRWSGSAGRATSPPSQDNSRWPRRCSRASTGPRARRIRVRQYDKPPRPRDADLAGG